jgi:N-methylhydantoinase A
LDLWPALVLNGGMTDSSPRARLAIDIGGTFTDVVLDRGGRQWTTKVLTDHDDPAAAVLAGIDEALAAAAVEPAAVRLVVHGTTLATNALIERRGARTALVTTEGHRDVLEMAHENRFEQYDIDVDRPRPLVPREWRFTVPERIDARGRVLRPLDEGAVAELVPRLNAAGIESVAIGLLHAYRNADHERRIAEILRVGAPGLDLSLSSEVCPEIREYERLSTTVANAYVKPLMARYLRVLADRLRSRGLECPCLLMTSGGGLTRLETGAAFPIRLVESGPAGGAMLAAHLARVRDLPRVLSFDMGGTTAKICLIDDGTPLHARAFEIDRTYRFRRGSGLPVRIPVIEMVEIGAGGGSLAAVDRLGRLSVGPESAGSHPGPASYGRGGAHATVTDADLLLGRIDSDRFAGGRLSLDANFARNAVEREVAEPLRLGCDAAAAAIVEIVDENMAVAARAHALEWGKDTADRTLVAFGGAAPLHATRVAEKLGIRCIVVPRDASVGSAIGFLLAPIAYEVVRSRHALLSAFAAAEIESVFAAMRSEAEGVVRPAAPAGSALSEQRRAHMRYVGQGHEIAVPVPGERLDAAAGDTLRTAFERAYQSLYGRLIPGLDVEVLSWTLTLSAVADSDTSLPPPRWEQVIGRHAARDQRSAHPGRAPAPTPWRTIARDEIVLGELILGPVLITEPQTTTVVAAGFAAHVDLHGDLVLERTDEANTR